LHVTKFQPEEVDLSPTSKNLNGQLVCSLPHLTAVNRDVAFDFMDGAHTQLVGSREQEKPGSEKSPSQNWTFTLV
jgi:hypothetical protein